MLFGSRMWRVIIWQRDYNLILYRAKSCVHTITALDFQVRNEWALSSVSTESNIMIFSSMTQLTSVGNCIHLEYLVAWATCETKTCQGSQVSSESLFLCIISHGNSANNMPLIHFLMRGRVLTLFKREPFRHCQAHSFCPFTNGWTGKNIIQNIFTVCLC